MQRIRIDHIGIDELILPTQSFCELPLNSNWYGDEMILVMIRTISVRLIITIHAIHRIIVLVKKNGTINLLSHFNAVRQVLIINAGTDLPLCSKRLHCVSSDSERSSTAHIGWTTR